MGYSSNYTPRVYVIRVETPDGTQHEVDTLDTNDYAKALAYAGFLAQWLHTGKFKDGILPDSLMGFRQELKSMGVKLKSCAVVVYRSAEPFEYNAVGGYVEDKRIPPETPHKTPRPHFAKRF